LKNNFFENTIFIIIQWICDFLFRNKKHLSTFISIYLAPCSKHLDKLILTDLMEIAHLIPLKLSFPPPWIIPLFEFGFNLVILFLKRILPWDFSLSLFTTMIRHYPQHCFVFACFFVYFG